MNEQSYFDTYNLTIKYETTTLIFRHIEFLFLFLLLFTFLQFH